MLKVIFEVLIEDMFWIGGSVVAGGRWWAADEGWRGSRGGGM